MPSTWYHKIQLNYLLFMFHNFDIFMFEKFNLVFNNGVLSWKFEGHAHFRWKYSSKVFNINYIKSWGKTSNSYQPKILGYKFSAFHGSVFRNISGALYSVIMKIGCVAGGVWGATKEGSQVGWGGRFMWLLKIGLCVCDKDRRAPNLSRGSLYRV